jgi:anti-sigma regulatory factor (Ser/Thr protein kinase)
MRELSLNILDIAQNSISAGATLIEITVDENTQADRLTVCIADNGRGMTPEQVRTVTDPFYTTRTTRRVGMGIPLLCMAAEQSGGSLDIKSRFGQGTTVTATFVHSHIDRPPLGDIKATVTALIRINPQLDFCFIHTFDGRSFTFDTRQLRVILGDLPPDTPEVAEWIGGYLDEQEKILSGVLIPDEND